MLMFCRKCGKLIEPNATVCSFCGNTNIPLNKYGKEYKSIQPVKKNFNENTATILEQSASNSSDTVPFSNEYKNEIDSLRANLSKQTNEAESYKSKYQHTLSTAKRFLMLNRILIIAILFLLPFSFIAGRASKSNISAESVHHKTPSETEKEDQVLNAETKDAEKNTEIEKDKFKGKYLSDIYNALHEKYNVFIIDLGEKKLINTDMVDSREYLVTDGLLSNDECVLLVRKSTIDDDKSDSVVSTDSEINKESESDEITTESVEEENIAVESSDDTQIQNESSNDINRQQSDLQEKFNDIAGREKNNE